MGDEFGAGQAGMGEGGAGQDSGQGDGGQPQGGTQAPDTSWQQNPEYFNHFAGQFHGRLHDPKNQHALPYLLESLKAHRPDLYPRVAAMIQGQQRQVQPPQFQRPQQPAAFDLKNLPEDIREALEHAKVLAAAAKHEQTMAPVQAAARSAVEGMGFKNPAATRLAYTLMESGLSNRSNQGRSVEQVAAMVKQAVTEAIETGMAERQAETQKSKDKFEVLTGGQGMAQFKEKNPRGFTREQFQQFLEAGAEAAQGNV